MKRPYRRFIGRLETNLILAGSLRRQSGPAQSFNVAGPEGSAAQTQHAGFELASDDDPVAVLDGGHVGRFLSRQVVPHL